VSIVQSGSALRLRYNHRSGDDGARQLLGVVFEDNIPGGSPLYINVDQPTALPQTDDAQRNGTVFPAATFVIEAAARAAVTPVAGGGARFNRGRTISVGGTLPNGTTAVAQVEPAWAAVGTLTPAIPATGLIAKGRYAGFVPVWPRDPNADVPDSGHRPGGQLLRVRLLGPNAETANIVDAGSNTGFTFQLLDSITPATNAADVAPGSVAITATVGGNAFVVRDTGDGRLVGQEAISGATADGSINYRTGIITLAFSVSTDAVNILADYEHGTLYLPLDIDLCWDAEMANG